MIVTELLSKCKFHSNNLVTFLEDVTIQMAERSSITYRRINHKNFAFHIKLANPELEKRKVIIRIFLGIKSEETRHGMVWWVISSLLGFSF